jgi:DNA-binding NtrC family response regulator
LHSDVTLQADDLQRGGRIEEPAAAGGLHVLIMTPSSFRTRPLPTRGAVTIGRGDNADIRLEDNLASKLHARLEIAERLVIVDLGSTNGTRLHDQKIPVNEPTVLEPGEGIRIGSTVLMIQRLPPGHTASPERRIWSHLDFHDRLSEECGRAFVTGKSLALVRVHAGLRLAAERALALLRAHVPAPHILAEYAGGEYEILFTEISDAEVKRLLEPLLSALRNEGAAAVFGLASYPREGRTAHALLSAANEAIRATTPGTTRALPADDEGPMAPGPTLQRVYELGHKAAASKVNILILGETGVGKEVLARLLHEWSPRRDKPFQAINCAGLPESLLESELFGHEKGAFTDAKQGKPGLLEMADGGTVFFDELGDMSPRMQQRLLRALEVREVQRVGGVKTRKVDIRVVGATNKNLEAEVEAGNFRSDMFYRFGGFVLTIPPLRERPEDIEPLARWFARSACKDAGREDAAIAPEAIARLLAHNWPGNVRELKNVIDRAVVLADDGTIRLEHLPRLSDNSGDPRLEAAEFPGATPGTAQRRSGSDGRFQAPRPASSSRSRTRSEEERTHMLAALQESRWNVSEAARRYEMPRRTFVAKMKKYRIPGPRAMGDEAGTDPQDDPPAAG